MDTEKGERAFVVVDIDTADTREHVRAQAQTPAVHVACKQQRQAAPTPSRPQRPGDREELLLLPDAPDEEEGVAEVLVAGALPQLLFGGGREGWRCGKLRREARCVHQV